MGITLTKIINDVDKQIINSFYNIADKYILCGSSYYGVLLDYSSNMIWAKEWEHSVFKTMYYSEKHNVLFTDRLSMPGPVTASIGICAIDMKSGTYLWNYWYKGSDERSALKENKDDIRLLNFSNAQVCGEYLLTGKYKIHVTTGNYSLIDENEIRSNSSKENLIIPNKLINDSLAYEYQLRKYKLNDSINLWGEKYEWCKSLIQEADENKLLSKIKVYKVVDYRDKRLLIIGKDLDSKKICVWILEG